MAEQDPIKHVVLLIMENHSFDQMLGRLQAIYPELDGVNIDAIDPRFNLDSTGNKVFQIPTDEQQVPLDPKHENRFVLDQIANHNSGFVIDFEKNVPENQPIDRQYVMGYYLLDRLPALHELARNFTVCDRWFSSLPGPTWPNRFFALSGTSSGRVRMPQGPLDPDSMKCSHKINSRSLIACAKQESPGVFTITIFPVRSCSTASDFQRILPDIP